MFGGTGPTGSTGTLFRDDRLSGFVHYVQWQTPAPVLLEDFDLYATHDAAPFDANERGFRRFTLLGRNESTEPFETIFEFFPTNPYTILGDEGLLLSQSIEPIVAQEFRAEFEQFGDRTPTARGPRVRELDGFGVVVPEPIGCALLIAAFGALITLRKRRKEDA